MSLVTVQRSPSPSDSPESDDGGEGEDELDDSSLKSPGRQRRSKSALKRLKKFFHTVRFISKLRPCISESYFAVKGAALILPQSESGDYTYTQKITRQRHATQGTAVTDDIQSHLQSMFYLLRSQDTIKVAVKCESMYPSHNRYMAVVSCYGKQDTEESVILGIDCNKTATIGLVLPIWADTSVKLNGDGGFIVCSESNEHIFKPVSVQAMWSALQSLNKVVKIARDNTYIPPGLTHTWTSYYSSRITSERNCITEWFISEDLVEMRTNPIKIDTSGDPDAALQSIIKSELKQIMMRVDLDEVTSRYLREALEEKLQMSLNEYKSFVDQEMMTILGQMDYPSMIKDYLYLGSEWNASNLEELTENGVDHILNISREVDNFFPEVLKYMNIKEWDDETGNLLQHWDNTYKFIQRARKENSKVLVHCKMGISRSSSTVMAYLMKEYHMSREEAFNFVKAIRPCVMPNNAFWKQLEIYNGILNASRKRNIFKSKSDQNLIQQAPIKEIDKEEEEEESEEEQILRTKFTADDLFLPLNTKPESGDGVFLQDPEKDSDLMFDIENRSRSADSTEESIDIPSPKGEGESSWKCSSYGVYIVEEKPSTAGTLDGESVPKFKSDSSWIKETPAAGETAEVESEKKPEQLTVDSECVSDVKDEVSEEHESDQDYTTDDKTVEETCGQVEVGVSQHYIKEKIPWNPGKVKKQKQSFEEKAKEQSSETESIPAMLLEGEVISESSDRQTDSSSEEEMPVDMQPSDDRPVSVYDMEDITLPIGIVRKTTQEIEERNKQSDSSPETPSIPLQRSSSLKERSSSKRKRESERRKTCMPILSPSAASSTDTSPTKEFVFPPKTLDVAKDSTIDIVPKQEAENGEIPHGKEDSSSGDIAVYKFGEEELSVEKGIVKKQKMDLEQKARERKGSDCLTPSSDVEKDFTPTYKDVAEGRKKSEPKELTDTSCKLGQVTADTNNTSDTSNKSNASYKNQENTENINTADTMDKKETSNGSEEQTEKDSSQLSVKVNAGNKSTFTKESSPWTPVSPPLVKRKKSDDSRLNAETLELIREIGSAFLNSPVKTDEEKVEEEQKAEEGGSLVKFLVRNIEKAQPATTKRKHHMKEIIIIDKETQEKKKKALKFGQSPLSETKSASPTDNKDDKKQKTKLTSSLSTPSSFINVEKLGNKDSQKSVDSVPESLVEGKPLTANTDTEVACSVVSDQENQQMENENNVVKVKNLVGKFEFSDKQQSMCPSRTSVPSTPIEETKMVIIESTSEEVSRGQSSEPLSASKEADEQDEESSVDSLESDQSREMVNWRQNLRKTEGRRPKSAEHLRRGQSSEFHEKINLTRAQTLPSPSETQPSSFSWEGRKLRKLHGKSHPLTKLEARKNPFYNTM